jgi:hypothetical protein
VAITLGSITFDPTHTTIREKHEEVGGRDARRIVISGLIIGKESTEEIEAALDAILAAASDEDHETELSLRSGRRLWVQRVAFTREVSKDGLAGSFVLDLDAKDPFEESTATRSVSWSITASGGTKSVAGGGNAFSALTITLVAEGNVVCPSFSNGTQKLTYQGTVQDGKTLVLDGGARAATLEGEDVTPYMEGVFPQIPAGGCVLTYEDDPGSSHRASVTLTIRDRWW